MQLRFSREAGCHYEIDNCIVFHTLLARALIDNFEKFVSCSYVYVNCLKMSLQMFCSKYYLRMAWAKVKNLIKFSSVQITWSQWCIFFLKNNEKKMLIRGCRYNWILETLLASIHEEKHAWRESRLTTIQTSIYLFHFPLLQNRDTRYYHALINVRHSPDKQPWCMSP